MRADRLAVTRRSAVRHRPGRARAGRLLLRAVLLMVAVLALPVPWQYASGSTAGFAWRLDGRLVVDGQRVDPPGRFAWLTVGRPVLLAELAADRLSRRVGRPPDDPPPRDLRAGLPSTRPAQADPVAAAAGMRAAGLDVPVDLRLQVSGPVAEGLPDAAVVTHLDGVPVVSRQVARDTLDRAALFGQLTFTTQTGGTFELDEPRLPYATVTYVEDAPSVSAAIGGSGPPFSWLRSLSVGSSHGLMVGLVTYVHLSGHDVAAGRYVAGTGRLFSDGTVGRIGGLTSKAAAARRSGADVLLVPATQAAELDGVATGGMQVLPVASLQDAIDQLAATSG